MRRTIHLITILVSSVITAAYNFRFFFQFTFAVPSSLHFLWLLSCFSVALNWAHSYLAARRRAAVLRVKWRSFPAIILKMNIFQTLDINWRLFSPHMKLLFAEAALEVINSRVGFRENVLEQALAWFEGILMNFHRCLKNFLVLI